MKTTKKKTTLSNKIKTKIQEKFQESKDIFQDRIQQIRRSYPYHSMDELPGLSVSLLAGDPNDNYSAKDTKFNSKKIISDVNQLALL